MFKRSMFKRSKLRRSRFASRRLKLGFSALSAGPLRTLRCRVLIAEPAEKIRRVRGEDAKIDLPGLEIGATAKLLPMAAADNPALTRTAFLRTIFHVDMDAFFVSVEELYDPSLKGKAVVVGGQRNERGVVSAASYEARKFGVHSAMPLRTAAKQCPHAIFVDGHPERYRECSEKVYKVLSAFTPQVEMASIDEAYLDMTGTGRLHGPPLKAAHSLHRRMKDETGLNCSVGIGGSRLVAKVSSGQAKPNGLLWIISGEEAKFLAPLDVREIPGVGKVMETHLHALGIKKVGDLARLEESELSQRFGKWGLALAGKARGEDAGEWFDSEVGADI